MNKITTWLLLAVILGQSLVYAAPLHDAAKEGNLSQVNMLLNSGVNPEALDDYGLTPLMSAAAAGQTEVVKGLLNRGASINALHNNNDTALMKAAMNGHAAVVKELLNRGADFTVKSYGKTALGRGNIWGIPRQEVINVLRPIIREWSIKKSEKITDPYEVSILDGSHPGSYERDYGKEQREAAITEKTGIPRPHPVSIIDQYLGE